MTDSPAPQPSDDLPAELPVLPYADAGNLDANVVVRDFSRARDLQQRIEHLERDLAQVKASRQHLVELIGHLDQVAEGMVEAAGATVDPLWAEGARQGVSHARVALQQAHRELVQPEVLQAIRRLADDAGLTVQVQGEPDPA